MDTCLNYQKPVIFHHIIFDIRKKKKYIYCRQKSGIIYTNIILKCTNKNINQGGGEWKVEHSI